ncbi:MAG: dihydroneopterin aldolase [Bacteroidia bacterium]|nr:dihydroneopterin aldolase [Bacteroidia bacterium]
MLRIRLNKIRLFARHGYYEEEFLLGGEYLIDIDVEVLQGNLSTDQIEDTLNYESLYAICIEEMAQRSTLLEHVIYRIKSNIISTFHQQVGSLEISLQKVNPPLGGSVESSEVVLKESYISRCSKCSKSFGCYNTEECWCKDINLSDVTRTQLKRQYDGCLCEDCLLAHKVS